MVDKTPDQREDIDDSAGPYGRMGQGNSKLGGMSLSDMMGTPQVGRRDVPDEDDSPSRQRILIQGVVAGAIILVLVVIVILIVVNVVEIPVPDVS